jgi:hypothetical protein
MGKTGRGEREGPISSLQSCSKVIITIIIHIIITIVVAVFCLGREREREFGERRGALQAGVGVPAACRFSSSFVHGSPSRLSVVGRGREEKGKESRYLPREAHEKEEEPEGRCNPDRRRAVGGSTGQQAASSSSDTQHRVASE